MHNPSHLRDFSAELTLLLDEASDATGMRWLVRDITSHPVESVRRTMGATDPLGVWVAPSLPSEVAEAVVAHECMHLLQYSLGWRILGSEIRPSGPGEMLHELGSVLSTAIVDPQADSWAMERGFDIPATLSWQWQQESEAFSARRDVDMDMDDRLLARTMKGITQQVKALRRGDHPSLVGEFPAAEIQFLIQASDWFNMAIRAVNLGIEFGQDPEYVTYLPRCREFGQHLMARALGYNLKSKKGAEEALRSVYLSMNLNSHLMRQMSGRRVLERWSRRGGLDLQGG